MISVTHRTTRTRRSPARAVSRAPPSPAQTASGRQPSAARSPAPPVRIGRPGRSTRRTRPVLLCGFVEQAAAAADAGLGQDQLDPLGRLLVTGDRRGHASGPARSRSAPGTSALGRSSSSRPGDLRLGLRELGGAVRVDGAAGVHVRVDQRRQRARAPAAPGPGRGGPPRATTGPAGTRSPRRPRRPRPAGARRPPPARAPVRLAVRPRRCGSRSPPDVPGADRGRAPAARARRARAAGRRRRRRRCCRPSRGAAASRPACPGLLGEIGEARPVPSGPSARCRRRRSRLPAYRARTAGSSRSGTW